MKHSIVFLTALDNLWEHACNLRLEKRQPDSLNSGEWLQAGNRLSDRSSDSITPQCRNAKTKAAYFWRRRSDRFIDEPRSPRPVVGH